MPHQYEAAVPGQPVEQLLIITKGRDQLVFSTCPETGSNATTPSPKTFVEQQVPMAPVKDSVPLVGRPVS